MLLYVADVLVMCCGYIQLDLHLYQFSLSTLVLRSPGDIKMQIKDLDMNLKLKNMLVQK